MKNIIPKIAVASVAILTAGLVHSSSAAVITWEYAAVYDVAAQVPGPNFRATLTDLPSNRVEFKLDVFSFTTAVGDCIKRLAFNYKGASGNFGDLQIVSSAPTTGTVTAPTLISGVSIPAGNTFDFGFDFQNSSSGGGRFEEGESYKIVLERSGLGSLTINDFLESVTGPEGTAYSGLFAAGNGISIHTYQAVPEPATVAFGLAMVGGLGIIEFKRRQKRAASVVA